MDILRVVGVEFGLRGAISASCGKMYFLSSGYQQVLWYGKMKINATLG